MASTGIFRPIRHSVSSLLHRSHLPLHGNLTLLSSSKKKKAKHLLEPLVFYLKPNQLGRFARSVLRASGGGRRFLIGVPFSLGSVGFGRRFACSMDGQDILMDDRESLDNSDEEGDLPVLWVFVRKLWLPASFILTVLLNWDHPIILVTKVALFLATTKPSPLSVYVFVEKICELYESRQPYLYMLKSLYASKVEVQDYKLLCLATIEVKHHRLHLVGILGGWWILPLSPDAFTLQTKCFLY